MEYSTFSSLESTINSLAFRLILSGRVSAGSEWRFMNHPAPANRLYFIFDGDGYIGNAGTKKRFEKNLIMLTTVNSFFDYVCESRLEKIFFHFRLELYPGKDIFDGVNDCLTREGDRSFFETLAAKAESTRMGDMLEAESMLLSAIAPFVKTDVRDVRKRIAVGEKYRRLFSAIDERCSLATTTKELAVLVGSSESTLVKNFRHDVGISLKQYLMDRIASRAKEEVHGTDRKVKDIARSLGFADEFYFSRFFKKHAGLSPAEYRKANILR
ncbi:MAG: helix-turn-helix transcriptional regulator [Spirochaetota bacterium]